MKRIVGIVIPLFTCAMIIAQDSPIINSAGYSKIIKGKEASFERAVASHVERFHGEGEWPNFVTKVISGPRTGQYFLGTSNHYWKDYADRVTTKAHNDNWADIISRHVEDQSGMIFFRKDLKASYNDRGSAMSEITWYYTKPGQRGKMLGLMRKNAEANKKANSDNSYAVYLVVSGGKQDGILAVVNRMDSMADMAFTGPSNREMWIEAFGEEFLNQSLKDWNSSYTKSRSEILQFLPGLSSPIYNNN